ncbi:MAG: phosphoribosylamine--glycine ligase [SAR202 cluster bacterium]|nr:phosphoribosylamine--glycine ligase [SAR202 cluster bacterium]
MKVLLIGNGGRENAIAWKICQSKLLNKLYVAPGNAGTAQIAENINIESEDFESIINFALEKKIDLVVIGPEIPLARGLSDKCKENGIQCFGPSKVASQLESSKQFAKSIMNECGIPNGVSVSVNSVKAAVDSLNSFSLPVVIKADGLAAGKGVFICNSKMDAETAIKDILEKKIFGKSGNSLIIEEFLEGPEISVFAFTDGKSISPLIGACDYKRIGEGDTGPNTGGMGAYSPAPFWNKEFEKNISENVFRKIINYMDSQYSGYVGVLFAGLIITKDGPKVLEFNCRLGDPETQVILPLLETDLLNVMQHCVNGTLESKFVRWSTKSSVTVVMASDGYPGKYITGHSISGLDNINHSDTIIFHAGTKILNDKSVITNGGRVLSVTAVDISIEKARKNVYKHLSEIKFEGSYNRTDIALI